MTGAYSVEDLTDTVRKALSVKGYPVSLAVAPHFSRGILPRVQNVRWATRMQGDVNHITGDIHYLAMGLPGNKTILTVLDLEMLNRMRGLKRWLMHKFWFDLPCRRVKLITVISESTKQKLLQNVAIRPEKVHVVPVAIASRFQPSPRPFNQKRPRLLQIGTRPNKNLPRLIAAVRGLPLELRIIGEPCADDLDALRTSKIDFSYEEKLTNEQVVEEYRLADMVSLVSTEEGFGMPIIEAQWIERPVITSNCSSMREVASDSACMVDPLDVESIRSGVIRMLADEEFRIELIKRGQANRLRYGIDAIANQYLELYRSVADKNFQRQKL
jgi:glycosyltransferase involved in cell wall biosynthesis